MNTEGELVKAYSKLMFSPLAFVYFNFPWGQEGSSLQDEEGPDQWQKDVLKLLGTELEKSAKGMQDAVRIAILSGHGIGKTALCAWILLFVMSTRAGCKNVCTANTKLQLEDKTWAELSKWHQLSINAHWFKHMAMRFSYQLEEEAGKNWFTSCTPWSKERSEAFAGTHAPHKIYLFDEASGIERAIWEVSEGAMTDAGSIHLVCGNPTRATGVFADCFTKDNKKNGGRWHCFSVDSRTAKRTNKVEIQNWAEKYGDDSDFFRVRVLGQPPRFGVMQLIGIELVDQCAARVIHESEYYDQPKIMGIDVARSGVDYSAIIKRQGLAAYELEKFSIPDVMQTASLVANRIREWEPDAVFIDVVGIGAGLVDRLRQLGFGMIIEVNGSMRASEPDKYYNKRTEMWCKMKDWMILGSTIPEDLDLKEDLPSCEFGFDNKDRFQLERKVDVKERLGRSPDCGDALALTFAEEIAPSVRVHGNKPSFCKTDYNVLEYGLN